MKFEFYTKPSMYLKPSWLALFISISCFLPAQTGQRFVRNPYSVTSPIQYTDFQVFVGQIPCFANPVDVQILLSRLTGVSIRFVSYFSDKSYGFVVSSKEEHRDRLIALNHRIVCERDGYRVYDYPVHRPGSLVLEIPRSENDHIDPNQLW